MIRLGFVMLVVLLLICSYLWADEVFMQDGTRFRGVVTEETAESISLKTEEGTVILNRNDIKHIERHEGDEPPQKGFFATSIATIQSLPRNNWFIVRKAFLRVHNGIFAFLQRRRVYQYISTRESVEQFRGKSLGAYYFAVYMIVVIIITILVSVIKNTIMTVIRRVFGIKQRYDL